MTKTAYTVPQVPGSKRTSERLYTHAVIGQSNLDAMRAQYVNADAKTQYAKDFAYFASVVKAGIGGMVQGHIYPVDQKWLESSQKAIEGCATADDFHAKTVTRIYASIEERHGAGDLGAVEVLQWSMSAANAAKSVGTHSKWHCNVQVVPCVPLVKAAA